MAVLEQTAVLTDAIRPVPASELEARLEKFRRLMDEMHPGWEMAAVNHKVAMYYFTGTMQEGVLLIRPQDAIFWVRRNYERAVNESHFGDIRPMHSFREAASYYGSAPRIMYVETKKLPWIGKECCISILPSKRLAPLMLCCKNCVCARVLMSCSRWNAPALFTKQCWMLLHRS